MSGNGLSILIGMSKGGTLDQKTAVEAMTYIIQNEPNSIFDFYDVLGKENKKIFNQKFSKILADIDADTIDKYYLHLLNFYPQRFIEKLKAEGLSKLTLDFLSRNASEALHVLLGLELLEVKQIIYNLWDTELANIFLGKYFVDKPRNSADAEIRKFLLEIMIDDESGVFLNSCRGTAVRLEYSELFSEHVKAGSLAKFVKKSGFLFSQPKNGEEIPVESNPIMLAAKFKKYEVLMYAYDNASKEPWNIYWEQISDEDGYIKTYLDEFVSIMVRERKDETKFIAFIEEKLYIAGGIKAGRLLKNFDAKTDGDIFAKGLMLHPAILDDYVLAVTGGASICNILEHFCNVQDVSQLLDTALNSDDDRLKRVLFDYMLEQGSSELFYQLLLTSKNSALAKHAWNYFKNNAGKVLVAFENKGLSIDGLKVTFDQNLTDSKLNFSKVIPPLGNHNTILKLLRWIDVPNGNNIEIDPLENPLIIAAKTAFGKKIIEYAFANRVNEPWKTYWSQCGDSENSVIVHCFKSESDAIFKWLLDNESILRNLNYACIEKMRDALRRNYRLSKKESLLNNKIGNGNTYNLFDYIYDTGLYSIDNRLENWILWRMVYQRGDNSSIRFDGFESANDIKFSEQICNVINSGLLQQKLQLRYPDIVDKLGAAREDHRLFMIMQFLKYGPDVGSHGYEAWVELVKLCGFIVADINDEFKNITFLQFKKLVEKSSRAAFISAVIKEQPVLGESKDVDRFVYLLKNKKAYKSSKDWLYQMQFAWATLGKGANNFGNFKGSILDFTLTCMLVVTDDVEQELSNINNKQQLLKLIEKQPLAFRTIIERIEDFSVAKDKVRTLLLQAQQSMEYSLMSQAIESCLANPHHANGSCPTGIYNRFGRNVINLHNKYSMVKPGGREDFISEFISREFTRFVDNYMLSLWRNNLGKTKIPPAKITALREAKTMADFKNILKTYTPEEIKAVVQIMPEMTDAEPRKFMDAIFSVAADEWYKLYVGDRKVLAYSSVLTGEEQRLSAKEINYERQKLLGQCFKYINSNVQRELQANQLAGEISGTEAELIAFKCKTLENRKMLDQIASNIYKLHSEIKALAVEPELVLSPVEKFSRDAVKGLIGVLSKSEPKPKTSQALVVAPKKKRITTSTLMNMFLKPRTVKAKAVNAALAKSAPTSATVDSIQLVRAIHDLILSEYGKSLTGDRQIVIDPESPYSELLSLALTDDPAYWKNQDDDDIKFSIAQFTKYLCKNEQTVAELQALITDPQDLTARFLQFLANKISVLDGKLELTGNNLTMPNLLLRIHERYVAKPVSLDDVEPPPKPVLFATEVKPETIETKSTQIKSPLIPSYPTLGRTAGSFAPIKSEGESKTTVQIKPKDVIRYYPEIQKTTGNLAAEVKPKQEVAKQKQEVAKQEPAPTESKPLSAVQRRIEELNKGKTELNKGKTDNKR